MLYIDTSVLVSALTNEQATRRVRGWLDKQNPEDLAISVWTITEFSAALSVKLRSHQLDEVSRAAALASFTAMVSDSLHVFDIDAETFRAAARLADRASSGVRAGDALHLAVTARSGASLITLDRPLARAAADQGLAVVTP